MNGRSATAALVVLLTASPGAAASEHVVILDLEVSRLSFTLDTTFHEVHGTLVLSGGQVRLDSATGAASGEITVDARRTGTGNSQRDRKMHGKVLESERYPVFVFRLQRVEGTIADAGRSEVRLVGSLSIHGADHPMILPASVEIDGDRLHADLRFEVPYVTWGMADPSLLFVRAAKTVQVSIRAEGRWGNDGTNGQ